MEECTKMVELRREIEKNELEEWRTRHARSRKRERGDVGVDKEKEKQEGERPGRMESFFCAVYVFFDRFRAL